MRIKILLGKRIKELRIKSNMTQSQLAETVGIDPKHQSCIETGKNFPSADLLEKFSKAFSIEPSELLKFDYLRNRFLLQQELEELITNCTDEQLKIIYRVVTSILK